MAEAFQIALSDVNTFYDNMRAQVHDAVATDDTDFLDALIDRLADDGHVVLAFMMQCEAKQILLDQIVAHGLMGDEEDESDPPISN